MAIFCAKNHSNETNEFSVCNKSNVFLANIIASCALGIIGGPFLWNAQFHYIIKQRETQLRFRNFPIYFRFNRISFIFCSSISYFFLNNLNSLIYYLASGVILNLLGSTMMLFLPRISLSHDWLLNKHVLGCSGLGISSSNLLKQAVINRGLRVEAEKHRLTKSQEEERQYLKWREEYVSFQEASKMEDANIVEDPNAVPYYMQQQQQNSFSNTLEVSKNDLSSSSPIQGLSFEEMDKKSPNGKKVEKVVKKKKKNQKKRRRMGKTVMRVFRRMMKLMMAKRMARFAPFLLLSGLVQAVSLNFLYKILELDFVVANGGEIKKEQPSSEQLFMFYKSLALYFVLYAVSSALMSYLLLWKFRKLKVKKLMLASCFLVIAELTLIFIGILNTHFLLKILVS